MYKLYCAIHWLGIYPIRKRYPPFEQPKPALLTSLLIKQQTSEYRQTTELYSNSTAQISVDYGDALHTLKRRVVRCAYTIFLRACAHGRKKCATHVSKGPRVAAFRSPLTKALDKSVETLGL